MKFEYEVGLTQKERITENYLKYSKDDYLNYQYTGFKTKKNLRLVEFEYVDFILGRNECLTIENNYIKDNNVYLSNIIFSSREKILFHNYSNYNLIFINCVFFSRIQFYRMTNKINITFDSCVIMENFSIANNEFLDIHFISSVINKLNIWGSAISDLSFINNLIKEYYVSDTVIHKTLSYIGNVIYKISVERLKCETDNFDFTQLFYLRNVVSIHNIKKSLINIKSENKLRLLETLSYIENNSIIKYNPIITSKIEYIKLSLIKTNIFNKLVRIVFGYFLLPSRIIISALIIIIGFLFLYYFNDYRLAIMNIDDIRKYLELSIKAFIGINIESNNDVFIFLSYLQRALGFLLTTSFTVALARKYLK